MFLYLPLPVYPVQFLILLLFSSPHIGANAVGLVVEHKLLLLQLVLLLNLLQNVGALVFVAGVAQLELLALGLDVVHLRLELVKLVFEGTHLALQLEHLLVGGRVPLLLPYAHHHLFVDVFLLDTV